MEESAKKNKRKPVNERAGYMILLVMALLFVVISFVMKEYEGMLVSVPTIIVVAVFLVRNGRFYVPPALIVLMSVVPPFAFSLPRRGASRYWRQNSRYGESVQ